MDIIEINSFFDSLLENKKEVMMLIFNKSIYNYYLEKTNNGYILYSPLNSWLYKKEYIADFSVITEKSDMFIYSEFVNDTEYIKQNIDFYKNL